MPDYAEFFLPHRDITELETPASDELHGGDSCRRLLVDVVQDMTDLSADDQIATLRGVFQELARSHVTHVKDATMLSVLYGFLRTMQQHPSHISREVRQLLAREATEKLNRLRSNIATFIAKETAKAASSGGGTEGRNQPPVIDPKMMVDPRSCVKIYVLLLAQLLLSDIVAAEAAAALNAPEGVAVVGPMVVGRAKKGRSRGTANAAAEGTEDLSGIDIATREEALVALTRLFDAQLAPLWAVPGGPGPRTLAFGTCCAVEPAVVHLLRRVVLHAIRQRCNVDGDSSNPVRTALSPFFTMISLCTAAYYDEAEQSRASGHTAVHTNPDPANAIGVPLMDALIRDVPSAKFVASWVGTVHEQYRQLHDTVLREAANLSAAAASSPSSDSHGSALTAVAHYHPAHRIVPLLFAQLCDATDAADGQAAKHASTFLEEIAKHHAGLVADHPQLLAAVMQSSAYELRKAALTMSSETIYAAAHYQPGSNAERHRDELLQVMLSRLMDLSPFVRNHSLHQWAALLQRSAVPRSFLLPLVDATVGRLNDRHYLVRSAALGLLGEIIRRNGAFGKVLAKDILLEKLHSLVATVRVKYDALAEGDPNQGEALFQKAMEDARRSLRPAILESEGEGQELGSSDSSSELSSQRNGGSDAAATMKAEDDPPAAAVVSALDPDALRLAKYECSLMFVHLMNKALGHAVELLDSRNERNVCEAMRFVVACSEYRVDDASKAVRRFLVMIFEGEPTIQQAVREGFVKLFFTAFATVQGLSSTKKYMASAWKLLAVLADGSEGEYNAVQRILSQLKAESSPFLNHLLVDAVWALVEGTGEASLAHPSANQSSVLEMSTASSTALNTTAASAGLPDIALATSIDRRRALRLYAMLTSILPKEICLRRAVLLSTLQLHSTDNTLLAYGIHALKNEALAPLFTPIPDDADPQDHPVLKLLYTHCCRSTQCAGPWMQVADAAISALHALTTTPALHFTRIVLYVAERYRSLTVAVSNEGVSSTTESRTSCAMRLMQLLFLVGHTALKHLVSIDTWERSELRALEERPTAPSDATPATTTTAAQKEKKETAPKKGRGSTGTNNGKDEDDSTLDVMHAELGMGSTAARRHAIEDATAKRRLLMLDDPTTIWASFAPLAVQICHRRATDAEFQAVPELRATAVLCLTKLMIPNPTFCADHLPLLFTIASEPNANWVVKTNALLALGDLCCVHPNLLEAYMRLKDKGLFSMLRDSDARVRAVTVQIFSHLVLGEMLRVHDKLHLILLLIADPEPSIAASTESFVQHFASKNRRQVGNVIPSLVPMLSSLDEESFKRVMTPLLAAVEHDKATELLVEKLCGRFGRFSERASRARVSTAIYLSYCLTELDLSSERNMKKLMAEGCYQQYRQWLRNPQVLANFQLIATKAKRPTGPGAAVGGGRAANNGGIERRDRATVDEWEARLLHDSAVIAVATASHIRSTHPNEEDEEAGVVRHSRDLPQDEDAVGAVPPPSTPSHSGNQKRGREEDVADEPASEDSSDDDEENEKKSKKKLSKATKGKSSRRR